MYRINEGALEIPAEWKDESINVLSAGSGGFSFVINRDELPWGMDFAEYIAQEIGKIGESLNGFKKLDEQADYELDGRAAHRLEYQWSARQGPIHQLVVMTAVEQRVLIFTGSMPNQLTAAQKGLIEGIVASFRFKPEEAEETPADAPS